MANNFYIVGQPRRTVQVLSQTEVADVQQVDFATLPHQVLATRYVPYQAWLAEGAAVWIGPLATAIEELLSGGLADDGTYTEEVSDTGLLAGFLAFTVSYQPPPPALLPSRTTVPIPINLLTLDPQFQNATAGGSPADRLRAAYDALVATAGL